MISSNNTALLWSVVCFHLVFFNSLIFPTRFAVQSANLAVLFSVLSCQIYSRHEDINQTRGNWSDS